MFITRILYGIAYFIVLIFEILKATIDVAARTLTGNVKPVIVEIETVLERPVSLQYLQTA